jgi:hypothetical protein
MTRHGRSSVLGRWRRFALVSVLLLAILVGATGVSCSDIPFASPAFREAAGGGIKDGVKSIVDAIVDGIFAAIENAGRGGSGSSN